MNQIRNSAKAIILRDGALLCTKNVGWRGDEYFILPGGGQNPGETLVEALERECLEEIGARVKVLALRYVRDYIGKNHGFAERHAEVHQIEYMFVCDLLDNPGTHSAKKSGRFSDRHRLDRVDEARPVPNISQRLETPHPAGAEKSDRANMFGRYKLKKFPNP